MPLLVGVTIGGRRQRSSSMTEVGAAVEELHEASTAIAVAVEEQSAATQEIARNVREAATGTQEVSRSIVGVTQAAQETGGAATQVTASAGELSRQSEALGNEVALFLTGLRQGAEDRREPQNSADRGPEPCDVGSEAASAAQA